MTVFIEEAQRLLRLAARQINFPRTHNLEELANLVADQGGALPLPPREFRRLNPFAVQFRYDDQVIALLTIEEAGQIAGLALGWANEAVHRSQA